MHTKLLVSTIAAMFLVLLVQQVDSYGQDAMTSRCVVLQDGYVSEYAWGGYDEVSWPATHPSHRFCVGGMMDWSDRFGRWLDGWQVTTIDLEEQDGTLPLQDVDLVIIDDVRFSVCQPYQQQLIEFVNDGGGLLYYAGKWALGGSPKDDYSVLGGIDSYADSALAEILPVVIQQSPDLVNGAKAVEITDEQLAAGIAAADWRLWAVHQCSSRGEVLAQAGDMPLIVATSHGQGQIIVYTADDLGWIANNGYRYNLCPYAGTLWQRLAARAVGQDVQIAAVQDELPELEKTPAFAHMDQPINFLWLGYVYYRSPEMIRYWANDLLSHSSTMCADIPQEIGDAGVYGWKQFGVPLNNSATAEDATVHMVGPDGEPAGALHGRSTSVCYNNRQALEYVRADYAQKAHELLDDSYIHYAHMGDETEYGRCYCQYCQAAFRAEYGHDIPVPEANFSTEYLDKWFNYELFRARSIGNMYAVAADAAREANPRLSMFSSLPQGICISHGIDLVQTQAGFDLLWEHTYPGTMVIRVGLNSALMEDAAVIQRRPNVPIYNLLQGFDSYDRVPHMPPAEYMRESTWQAIAHGVDSVGWFVYSAFWWVLPGTDAWEECGQLAENVLEPLTPTLYQMRNADEPVAVLWCYSQEVVDGLKEIMGDESDPWHPIIRWYTNHATQEAYEVLKYAHVPCNVINEHRLWDDQLAQPWQTIIIPYVEYLAPQTRQALTAFMQRGGKVYVGADSTVELAGIEHLPMAFDAKVNAWWPRDRRDEWNQRRVRQYVIDTMLEKAQNLPAELLAYRQQAPVQIDDPQVVFNARTAGDAEYVFLINDHQVNPATPEMRQLRQQYNHFMLMPMTFPTAQTQVSFNGTGYLYEFNTFAQPITLEQGSSQLELDFEGGAGRLFVILPRQLQSVRIISQPRRTKQGVTIQAMVNDTGGIVNASIPLKVQLRAGDIEQTAYTSTQAGIATWTVPWLKDFPQGPIEITVTDLIAGNSATAATAETASSLYTENN